MPKHLFSVAALHPLAEWCIIGDVVFSGWLVQEVPETLSQSWMIWFTSRVVIDDITDK